MKLLPNLCLPNEVIEAILSKTMADIIALKRKMYKERKENPIKFRKPLHLSGSNLPSRKVTQSSISSQNLYINRLQSS